MKKIIATIAVIATTCFGFYLGKSGSLKNVTREIAQNVSYENMLVLGNISVHPLDIGQADIN